MTALKYVLLIGLLLMAGEVQAGDKYRDPYCRVMSDAQELVSYTYKDRFILIDAVRTRLDEAIDIAGRRKTRYTAGGAASHINPLFLWAKEAKISCGKAYGFLRKKIFRLRQGDADLLQKCECFHSRMVYYSGRR